MIDKAKFAEFCQNMYDAIDIDNEGTLPVPQVKEFVINLLEGHQVEG